MLQASNCWYTKIKKIVRDVLEGENFVIKITVFSIDLL